MIRLDSCVGNQSESEDAERRPHEPIPTLGRCRDDEAYVLARTSGGRPRVRAGPRKTTGDEHVTGRGRVGAK